LGGGGWQTYIKIVPGRPRHKSPRRPQLAPHKLGPFLLDSGDETLCAPAFGAFVDPVHKARLFRFGAGKPHLRATLDTEQALKRIFAFGL
jgi:hypothetical protein